MKNYYVLRNKSGDGYMRRRCPDYSYTRDVQEARAFNTLSAAVTYLCKHIAFLPGDRSQNQERVWDIVEVTERPKPQPQVEVIERVIA